jgi:hypothetical protein
MGNKMFLLVMMALAVAVFGQEQPSVAQHDMGDATESMSHRHHHEMGPHMLMSTLRPAQPGDQEKAQAIVDQVRPALERYKDYKAALADGYKIFLPNVPQSMYHFTNWANAAGEAFRFDAARPTSLLYEKHGDDYRLIGAMYTAPLRFTEEQLNQRVPLSVAQWHQHVNLCRPPKGQEREMLSSNPKFGLAGSISTQEACEAAGGTFVPHIFGWMVHVYPWEKTPDEIWSVERQMQMKDMSGSEHHHHDGMEMSH